jgi:signal peptidase I
MQTIGFGILEFLSVLAAITGVCWLLARRHRGRARPGGRKPFWVTWGAEAFVVVGLVLAGRVALADWQRVPSGSMEPTLRVGDFLLVDKLAYGPRLPFTNTALPLGEPQRGDVVVFRFPGNVSQMYVKRLVGLPGDVVRYRAGAVSVNGEPFQAVLDGDAQRHPEDRGQLFVHEEAAGRERTIKVAERAPGAHVEPVAWEADPAHCRVESRQAWSCTVPAGHYLMLGDNRDNSADSRVWGFLDAREVYGKAVRVLANPGEWSRSWSPL